MQYQYLTEVLGIQGFKVIDVRLRECMRQRAVVVYLERTNKEYRCGGYGAVLRTAYDGTEQEVQHLMLWKQQ